MGLADSGDFHEQDLVKFSLAFSQSQKSLATGYPGFSVADAADAGIAEGRLVLRDQNAFRGPKHLERIGIHLGDEERCAVTHDVIVVGTLACVDQE